MEARATNVDRESAGCGIWGRGGRDHRLLGPRFLYSVDQRAALSSAVLLEIHNRWLGHRFHRGDHSAGHHRVGSRSGISERQRQRS